MCLYIKNYQEEKLNAKEAQSTKDGSEIYNLRKKLKTEQDALTTAKNDLEAEKGKLSKSETELSTARKEVKDKQDELDRLRDTHSQDMKAIKDLQLLQLKTLLAEIAGNLNTQYEAEVGKINDKISRKDLALSALHRQLTAAQIEINTQAEAHTRQQEEWSTTDSERQARLEAVQEELEACKQSLADLQETVKAERDAAITQRNQASRKHSLLARTFGVFGNASTPRLPLEEASLSRNASFPDLTGRR